MKNNRGKRILYFNVYTAVCVLVSTIQLFLGTNILVILMALVSMLLAGIPLFFFGMLDIAALFVSGLLSKYSILPFLIKTLMGERIDIGLLAVDKTFPVILVGSMVTVAALFTAKTIHIRRRLLEVDLSTNQLLLLGYMSFGFGFMAAALHTFLKSITIAGETLSGFGGLGSFNGMLYFGTICTTAYITKSHSHKVLNITILLMLAASLLLSFISNQKIYFTFALLSYIITLYLFGRRLSLRYIIVIVVLVTVYIGVLVPIIQVLRSDAFKELGLQQRIKMTSEQIIDNVIESYNIASLSRLRFYYDYYPKLHTPIIDRLEMVQDLDLVLDGVDASNTISWKPIPMALVHITPNFLISKKQQTIDVDLILHRIGYTHKLMPLRRSLGLYGVSYAMFMWPGWIIVTFSMIFTFILLIRKLVHFSVAGNIFGIYFLVQYGFTFSETSVQNLLGIMLRSIPFDVVLILIFVKIVQKSVRSCAQF